MIPDGFYHAIDVSERIELNTKLIEEYKKQGTSFEIDEDEFENCKVVSTLTGKIQGIYCGTFYHDFTNVMPVISMAHELGHYHDITKNHDGNARVYYSKLGVLNVEFRAWVFAVGYMKNMGFKQWDAFMKLAYVCLSSYYSNPHVVEHRNIFLGYKGQYQLSFTEAIDFLSDLTGSYDFERIPC